MALKCHLISGILFIPWGRLMKKVLYFLLVAFFPLTEAAWAFDCNSHCFYGIEGSVDDSLCRDGYAVGYDYLRKVPKWVAYRITRQSVSDSVPLDEAFAEDMAIPYTYRSRPDDYAEDDFVMGQMAPTSLVGFTPKAAKESYLLSNTVPQIREFNQGIWKAMAERIRGWTMTRGDLFVISGPVWGEKPLWMGHDVGIPSGFFAVVYDPYPNEMLAFVFPHQDITPEELPSYQVPVDTVEIMTGLDFHGKLSDRDEFAMESSKMELW